VPPDAIATALGMLALSVSPAFGRDDDSVWRLSPRPVRVRSLEIVPAGLPPPPGALTMTDGPAFGTGLHPTTALCLEALDDLIAADRPERMLDIGTGSGILALAALRRGVASATGLDLDQRALHVAAENARLNGLAESLWLVCGCIDAVRGTWPLVVANIRAAELMAMAPVAVRRIGSRGHLVLSGIPHALTGEVEQAYRRLGMTPVRRDRRGGWTAIVLRASW
jgi:ribosomal protein L11 methyltransferase